MKMRTSLINKNGVRDNNFVSYNVLMKVKKVNSWSFLSLVESTTSLFYHLEHKSLI